MGNNRKECANCGAILDTMDGKSKCPYCGYGLSKAFKVSQDTDEEEWIETQEDCLRAVDKCFAQYDGGYRRIICQIVDCISLKKNFGIAYQVLKKIDGLDLGAQKKMEMAVYFIEKMNVIIQEEIRPFLNFMMWKSYEWGKGFRNDDYVKYRDIVIRYQRKRRR